MKKFLILGMLMILASMGCTHPDVPLGKPQPVQPVAYAVQASSPARAFASSGGSPASSELADQKGFIDWLLSIHGELPRSHPLAPKATHVFERVLRVADKRSGRLPKLLLIQEADDPWAMCLENGTVIMTQKGLEFCYQDVEETVGDTRLAFILGHELAHLAKDDFWEYQAFEMVRRFGSGERGIQEILSLLSRSEETRDPAYVREIRKEKELKADQYGLLYAAMAGYDPKRIVDDANGENFFREWVDQITGKVAYTDEEHPDPEQRAAFLLSYMDAVKADLILFDLGVRLYQIGMFKDAHSFLHAFQKRFPCREVSNNIGLVHYELALSALPQFNREAACTYKLSTLLDTETRARTFRGNPEEKFHKEIKAAIRNFEHACNQDRLYVPALVNLSSALAIKRMARPDDTENLYAAMKALKEASKLKKGDPKVLNNHAVVMHLLGAEFGTDNSGKAAEMLRDVIREHPEFSDPYYNLARILEDRDEPSSAKDAWETFLDIEPSGIYADMARRSSGMTEAVPEVRKDTKRFNGRPPVEPGEFDRKTEQYLSEVPKQSFDLENVRGEYYVGDGFHVLVLEDEVELVEMSLSGQMHHDELISEYGEPNRVFTDISGKKILVYERFAVDIRDGVATKVAFFEKQESL